jgi:hypothetical protein
LKFERTEFCWLAFSPFPSKYFPRNSSAEGLLQNDGAAGGANVNNGGANVGQLLHSYQSLAAMRDRQLKERGIGKIAYYLK